MTPRVERVALNALFLAPGESGGPETYLRQLAPALAEEYPALQLLVVTTASGGTALLEDGWGDFAEIRSLPAEEYRRARRQLAEQLALPLISRRSGVDLLHNLANTGPIFTPGLTTVLTLHDVIFMTTGTLSRASTLGLRWVVPRVARRADGLISGSGSARDEICSALPLDPARFTVVPHGVGPVPRARPAGAEGLRARLRVEQNRVILCLAAVRPHKNQGLLVRAAGRLPADVVIVLQDIKSPTSSR